MSSELPTKNKTAAWKDKVLYGILAAVCAGVISWGSWASVKVNSQPDRAEVVHMIETHAPYIEDRNMIMRHLERNDQSLRMISQVIDRNTEAINQLRIGLAKSGKLP